MEETAVSRTITYETKGLNLVTKEFRTFAKNSFGSIITREFLTVAVPILLLWEFLPRLGVVPQTLVPPPSTVALTFWDLLVEHDFMGHLGSSLLRFFSGLVLGLLLAFPIGILMGWNMFLRRHSLPLFQILAPIPPPAWVPITIIFLGVGLPMQTFLVFLGAFYPILFNTYQAVKDTEPRYIASARVYGASEFTLIKHVYVPAALGSVIMGIKIGIALGLVMLVIAEMYGAPNGIGWLLVESKEFFRIDRMVVCMLTLGFMGWFLIEIMKHLELKLAFWKAGR
ncbi:MAG: putative aliphatic sulfonates transport permease protein SsuC [Dehalococcoidia bacterium]|nr:putative aliphatic sulfonates transport permease protein SsuC [Bacillota bacterium]